MATFPFHHAAEQPIQQMVVGPSLLSGVCKTVIVTCMLVYLLFVWADHEMGLTTSSEAT